MGTIENIVVHGAAAQAKHTCSQWDWPSFLEFLVKLHLVATLRWNPMKAVVQL